MKSHKNVDLLLEEGRPAVHVDDHTRDALSSLVRAFEDEDVRTRATQTRRIRQVHWKLLVALILTAVAVPVGAQAISSLTANTGQYGDPDVSTEVVDRSEWLALGAEDAPEVIASLYDDSIELPEGAQPSDVVNPVSETLAAMGVVPEGETGIVATQESTVRTLFEKAARCLWYREWLHADSKDSTERRDLASQGILAAASWPATTASDGGGVVEMLAGIGQQAAQGNRNAIVAAYSGCAAYYGPVTK